MKTEQEVEREKEIALTLLTLISAKINDHFNMMLKIIIIIINRWIKNKQLKIKP